MRTKSYNVYFFDELSEEAKEKAVFDHIKFEISEIGLRNDDKEVNPYYQYAEEMERNQTPWFLHELIYEKEKETIIETIRSNGYEFKEDGTID